jgi:hypothetical protein
MKKMSNSEEVQIVGYNCVYIILSLQEQNNINTVVIDHLYFLTVAHMGLLQWDVIKKRKG